MSSTLIILTAVFVLSAHNSQGVLVMTSTEAQITLVAEHLFIFAFGVSWGPVVWVLLGEMFPNRIRAPALALGAGTQWVTAFIVTTTFPGLLSSVGRTDEAMNRADAFVLLNEYVKDQALVRHMLAVEAAMRACARKLG